MDRNETIEKHYRRNYKRQVHAMARRVGYHNAEDLVQEAYFRALFRWEQFDPMKSQFATWFESILRNARKDMQEDLSKPGDGGDTLPTLQPSVAEEWCELGNIQRLLNEESKENRTIIMQALLMGYDYDLISQSTQTPLGTIKSVIHRFRERLK